MDLSDKYWDDRYKNNEIGWDLGAISPPIRSYIDQLVNTDMKILIPGGGHSYEAEYLFKKGFNNVYVVDVSKTALKNFKSRNPEFPKDHLILGDFFDVDLSFDLILEQTFFCAINPNLRPAYVAKAFELLNSSGSIVGLLFNVPLNDDQPPFGGDKQEYLGYFHHYFEICILEPAHNSAESRKDKELFFKFVKKPLPTPLY